jgi:hypothetical protein
VVVKPEMKTALASAKAFSLQGGEGLREAMRRTIATPDEIMKAAQRRRIWTKLRPYLEAMVEHGG